MDKIAELCAAEQKYLDKLQLVLHTYGRLAKDASDPEIEADVRIDLFPGIVGQCDRIFKYYEEMLEVHSDLYEFWTHSAEEYLDVDRCGQLFYHGLLEDRFDVYLHHIVSNPLRHKAIQEDMTAFIEHAIDQYTEDILLLTGYECFQFPVDHLHFYRGTFGELISNEQPPPQSVIDVGEMLNKLLRRISEAARFSTEIRNCETFLPVLGTYKMSSELMVRDYKEGQVHKAELFLFSLGVLVARQKSVTWFSRKECELDYDSYFTMDQIELDTDCFRLKDPTTKLTCYKVMERRRDLLHWDTPRNMKEFLQSLEELKRGLDIPIVRIEDLDHDLGDMEVINASAVEKQYRKSFPPPDGGELFVFHSEHTVRISQSTPVTFAEAFNVKLCNTIANHRDTIRDKDQPYYNRRIRILRPTKYNPRDKWVEMYRRAISSPT